MPETMSSERVALLRHLGAEVVLTPGILMGDAIARAIQMSQQIADSFTRVRVVGGEITEVAISK
jgi:cysteine synthase